MNKKYIIILGVFLFVLCLIGFILWHQYHKKTPMEIASVILDAWWNNEGEVLNKKMDGLKEYFDLDNGSGYLKEMWGSFHRKMWTKKAAADAGDLGPLVVREEIYGNRAFVFTLYIGKYISSLPGVYQTFLLIKKDNGKWIITDFLNGWGNSSEVIYGDYKMVIKQLEDICRAEGEIAKIGGVGQGINNYWVGDVAGLFWLRNKNKEMAKLIPLYIAQADYNPLGIYDDYKAGFPLEPFTYDWTFHSSISFDHFKIQQGFVFQVLEKDEDGNPYVSDDAKTNKSKYGFIAVKVYFNSDEGKVSGIGGPIFIVNQNRRICWKHITEINGLKLPPELLQYPTDPKKAGWKDVKMSREEGF